jgi:NAD(P)-dependent dehydrogenase (short-subunit alcohol dehydrogenase family)
MPVVRSAVRSRLSYDRFHDFERTMQLNYFGSMRLIMGFMPKMTERRKGHIINISSIGVLANSPRFSAYVASKAALDAFSRCAQGELSGKGISFTTINMPLVKTPMIAPTKMYDSVPTLSPGRSGRPAGQGDHREAEPHRHPPGDFLGPAQRGGAEGLRSGDEHRVRAVPGFGRGEGRPQGAEGRAAEQRADRVRVTHARRALVIAGCPLPWPGEGRVMRSVRAALLEADRLGAALRGLQLHA